MSSHPVGNSFGGVIFGGVTSTVGMFSTLWIVNISVEIFSTFHQPKNVEQMY